LSKIDNILPVFRYFLKLRPMGYLVGSHTIKFYEMKRISIQIESCSFDLKLFDSVSINHKFYINVVWIFFLLSWNEIRKIIPKLTTKNVNITETLVCQYKKRVFHNMSKVSLEFPLSWWQTPKKAARKN